MVRLFFSAVLAVGLMTSSAAVAGAGCFGKSHTAQVAGQTKAVKDKVAQTTVKQSKPVKSGVSVATVPKKK